MEEKTIRVAQIVGNAENGGVEAMVINFYRYMDHSRVVFDFYMHGPSLIINEEIVKKYGGRIVQIPSIKRIHKYRKVLKENFRKNNYDIIHSNINTTNFVPLGIAKKCDIKVRIAHSHSTSNKREWIRTLIKNILRPFSKCNATHYFACSEKAGTWLFGKKFFNSGNVTLINNAIDIEKFLFNENLRKNIRSKLALNEETFLVGHVGRFKKQKNHYFLIKIFSELLKLNKKTCLLLIGEGKRMNSVKEIVQKEEINNVIFTGAIPNAHEYYNAMDCFILPSLYEGFPVVGVEAQTNGLKTYFSTNITSEAKLLDNTEYISLKDGPKVWAQKINEYIKSNQSCRQNSKVSRQYDVKSISEKIEQLYFSFLSKNRNE
jgi:glycosyltransferase EpsF